MSFIYVGWKSKKLLKVKLDNLGYFEDLTAYVAFITYLIARVTKFPVRLRFRLLGLFWLPV